MQPKQIGTSQHTLQQLAHSHVAGHFDLSTGETSNKVYAKRFNVPIHTKYSTLNVLFSLQQRRNAEHYFILAWQPFVFVMH